MDQKSCQERQCIWDSTKRADGVPLCYMDVHKVGYHLNGVVKKGTAGLEADLKVKEAAKTLLKSLQPIQELRLSVDFLTEKILRLKIFDPKSKRYEVPVQFDLVKKGSKVESEEKRTYSVHVSEEPKLGLQLSVERKSTKTKL